MTSIVDSPLAMAVALPLPLMAITAGFVLDQRGAGPNDGGTPTPSSTVVENATVSPTRIALVDGSMYTAMTGANAEC
jgi:hypothetical protein